MTVAVTDDGQPGAEPEQDFGLARAPGRSSGGQRRTRNLDRQGHPSPFLEPSANGLLSVGWSHHRGPGQVTFNPPYMLVKDGQASTQATFSEPGEYVIRAYGDDSIGLTPVEMRVTVDATATQSLRD